MTRSSTSVVSTLKRRQNGFVLASIICYFLLGISASLHRERYVVGVRIACVVANDAHLKTASAERTNPNTLLSPKIIERTQTAFTFHDLLVFAS